MVGRSVHESTGPIWQRPVGVYVRFILIGLSFTRPFDTVRRSAVLGLLRACPCLSAWNAARLSDRAGESGDALNRGVRRGRLSVRAVQFRQNLGQRLQSAWLP